jgi:hypothetical protein
MVSRRIPGEELRSLIARNAAELHLLHTRVHETWRQRPGSPEHLAACSGFRDAYDALAFPGGLAEGLERLRTHDPEAVENAIKFLEVDPWFFRSGYIKEEILRRLKSAPLTSVMKLTLERLIMRSLGHGGRREARAHARLAGAIASPALAEAMETRTLDSNPEVRRRARQVLHVMRSTGVVEGKMGSIQSSS